jgi:large subunit ribosomal protein L6
MSRIGKKAIFIPEDVSVTFNEVNKEIIVKGKHGILKRLISNEIEVLLEDKKITLSRLNDEKKSRELHGLNRALLQNMVKGVANKFSKTSSILNKF